MQCCCKELASYICKKNLDKYEKINKLPTENNDKINKKDDYNDLLRLRASRKVY